MTKSNKVGTKTEPKVDLNRTKTEGKEDLKVTSAEGLTVVAKKPKNVVKKTTKSRGSKRKKAEKNAEASYNEYGVRCIKDAFKIFAENHPMDVYKFIGNCFKNAETDPRYAEIVIKCIGNFDAQKTELSGSIETSERKNNPLFELSIDEIRKLKALKGGK